RDRVGGGQEADREALRRRAQRARHRAEVALALAVAGPVAGGARVERELVRARIGRGVRDLELSAEAEPARDAAGGGDFGEVLQEVGTAVGVAATRIVRGDTLGAEIDTELVVGEHAVREPTAQRAVAAHADAA